MSFTPHRINMLMVSRFPREDLVRIPSSSNPLGPMFWLPPDTSRFSLHYSFLTILVSLLAEMPWTGPSRNKPERPRLMLRSYRTTSSHFLDPKRARFHTRDRLRWWSWQMERCGRYCLWRWFHLTSVRSPLELVMLMFYGESGLEVGFLRSWNRRRYLLAWWKVHWVWIKWNALAPKISQIPCI